MKLILEVSVDTVSFKVIIENPNKKELSKIINSFLYLSESVNSTVCILSYRDWLKHTRRVDILEHCDNSNELADRLLRD